jgi:hypothetical protein
MSSSGESYRCACSSSRGLNCQSNRLCVSLLDLHVLLHCVMHALVLRHSCLHLRGQWCTAAIVALWCSQKQQPAGQSDQYPHGRQFGTLLAYCSIQAASLPVLERCLHGNLYQARTIWTIAFAAVHMTSQQGHRQAASQRECVSTHAWTTAHILPLSKDLSHQSLHG